MNGIKSLIVRFKLFKNTIILLVEPHCIRKLVNLSHNTLEELINYLKLMSLSRKLFLDISGCENIFKIDPLLLAGDPLFDDLSESE